MEEIKQFDVWTCDFSNIGGFERFGIRPCIIISNNTNNHFSDVVNVIPLTTSSKSPLPTHCIISSGKVTSFALCENVMSVKVDRLGEFCWQLNEFETQNIIYCLKKQFEIQ